ncbi:MAG TPA: aromatic ring-hydroxylating dioxygenase subunit alpha, partial [Labilithrix sp.]|nr:aromatic ring-hydroxylating dioxygenase subunit alpha [Labilithrix sp.]
MTASPSFRRAWVAVGRTEDLPRPGAWLKVPLTPAGVVVVRQPDGALLAFHAICTHRGTAFLQAEEGQDARFTCPYHSFQFELDGRACAQTADLAKVRVGTAHGFVFVTLDDAAPSLEESLGELPPWLARADLGRLRRVGRTAYDVAARWNLVVENFQESLHFASVHPALEALTPSAEAETWMPEGGGPWLGGRMPLVDGAETVSRSGRRSGRPWIVPAEDRRVVHDAMRFPNLLTSLQPDYLLTFVLFPRGEGRTRVIASTYVHEDTGEEGLEDVLAFWSQVYEEDRVACERQQQGLASREMAADYTDVEEGAAAVARMVAESETSATATTTGKRHCGIFGKPYADLSGLIDTSDFSRIHHEITRGLATVETS